MKNRFFNGRFSYSFTSRIHGNVLAWVQPASKSDKNKRVIENILRWEDDGGQMPDIGKQSARLNPGTARGQASE